MQDGWIIEFPVYAYVSCFVDTKEAGVAAFDVHGGIHFFALSDLTRVHSITTNPHHRYARLVRNFIACLTLFRFILLSPDGVAFGITEEGVFKASIFSAELRYYITFISHK